MGKTAAPHQLAHGIIIRRILKRLSSTVDNGPQKSLRDLIRHPVFLVRNKIPFQCVHHDIRNPASDLVFRKCKGKLRIHNGKGRPVQLRSETRFLPDHFIGKDRRVACLTSRGRNRQHNADLCRPGQRHFLHPDIPKRNPGICHSMGNGLGRIDSAASTYAQDKIHLLPDPFFHPLFRKCKPWIWFYASKLCIGDSLFFQRLFNPLQQSRSSGAASAVYNQRFCPSMLFHFSAAGNFCVFSKHNLCRHTICKIPHLSSSFQDCFLAYFTIIFFLLPFPGSFFRSI